MLTTYITYQYTRGQYSNFNLIGFLVPRFLRLTPQILILILLTFLLPLGGWASGPIWKETIDPVIENCYSNWWWDLFYLQNWIQRSQVCALHTWYLACDMQFHWLSTLIIVPLLYKKKVGLLITYLAILVCYLSTIIISYSLDIPPGTLNTARDEHFWANYIEIFYHRPYSHSSSFFIGLLFGYIAYYKKFIKLNKVNYTLNLHFTLAY